MRNFITTLTTKLSPKVIGLTIALLSAVVIPAAVLAYGPERPTFTQEVPATYVTFDSITNNPVYGDERNFMKIKEAGTSDSTYSDTANLVGGKTYTVSIFYHNNAASNYNASGQGIAQGAYARAELPAMVNNGASTQGAAYLGATNANPTSVYDDVTFQNSTGGDVALRYVPGSTVIHNSGATNGQTMPDTIVDASGVKLGYDSLNGTLPGCNNYAGYITFNVTAAQANFTFTKQVRMHGTKDWSKTVSAKPGDTVDYLLSYENTGTTEQKDVVFRDTLPAGLTYVPGSSKIQNGNFPDGKTIGDEISQGGMNIGTYEPTADGYLAFSATVNADDPCETLTNKAAVETLNGNLTDTANVNVSTGSCTPPAALPQTGPVEVIGAFVGLAAITFGVAYYYRSRKDLRSALFDAQTTPLTHIHKTAEHHAGHKAHSDK